MDVIAGDLNYDLSNVYSDKHSDKLLDYMILYTEVVNEQTYIYGSKIDHAYEWFVKRVSYKGHSSKHKLFWSWCFKN